MREEESKERKGQASEEDSDQSGEGEEVREEFIVKLKGLSYLETRWLTEKDFSNYSFQCQQKLKRYLVKREKLLKGLCAPSTD